MAHASSRGGSDRNILVIGKTGNGKSATCNTILSTDDFQEGEGGLSQTTEVQLSQEFINGGWLTVIDTPGTMDVLNPDAAMKSLESSLKECPEGVDAFILVFRYDVRATEEEVKAAEMAIKAFGAKALQRTIAVYTHCEKYNKDKKGFEKKISELCNALPRLKQLLSGVEYRVLMLDNRKDCDPNVQNQQVKDLLMLVEDVAKHNGQRFKKNDQESESDAKTQLMLIYSELRQAQLQGMFEQRMMVGMMLKMHAREFGIIMENQRQEMEETLERLKIENEKQQQQRNKLSICSIT